MDLQDYAKMAKDPEFREAIVKLAAEAKEDIYPLLTLMKEIVGEDLDALVDEVLKWSVNKTKFIYTLYREDGFNHEDAMSLTINSRQNILESIRHAK